MANLTENIIELDMVNHIVKRGRPIGSVKAFHIVDDPQYFNKYYREHLSQKINCDICNKPITKAKLQRHKLSRRCSP
jgi:hypothetical protein